MAFKFIGSLHNFRNGNFSSYGQHRANQKNCGKAALTISFSFFEDMANPCRGICDFTARELCNADGYSRL